MEECLAYVMIPNPPGRPLDVHLQAIASGYSEFNLDVRILNQAVLDSYERLERKYAN